jgi:hypothetical protein
VCQNPKCEVDRIYGEDAVTYRKWPKL